MCIIIAFIQSSNNVRLKHYVIVISTIIIIIIMASRVLIYAFLRLHLLNGNFSLASARLLTHCTLANEVRTRARTRSVVAVVVLSLCASLCR